MEFASFHRDEKRNLPMAPNDALWPPKLSAPRLPVLHIPLQEVEPIGRYLPTV
jgi:hypothetical protein